MWIRTDEQFCGGGSTGMTGPLIASAENLGARSSRTMSVSPSTVKAQIADSVLTYAEMYQDQSMAMGGMQM